MPAGSPAMVFVVTNTFVREVALHLFLLVFYARHRPLPPPSRPYRRRSTLD